METPFALLNYVAKIALRGLDLGLGGELIEAFGPALLRDAWEGMRCWLGIQQADGKGSTGTSLSLSLTPLGTELERLVRAKPEELKAAIKKAVNEVAGDHSREVRQALAKYLAKVPNAIRKSLKRPDDPEGLSVPPDRQLVRPEDLLSIFPERLPVVKGSSGGAAKPETRQAECETIDHVDSMRVTLTAIAGEHSGKSFTLEGHETFMVGRSPAAHFRLSHADRFFSRIHFMVEVNPPCCRLTDMGSRNGTHLNGARIQGADLKDGDKIKAGRTILQVRIEPVKAVPVSIVPSTPRRAAAVSRAAGFRSARVNVQPAGSCPVCLRSLPSENAAPETLCNTCKRNARALEQSVPGYRIVRELGRGGMGVVYAALCEADGQAVALKTIRPAMAGSRAQLDRFLREARILQELDHPYIVAFRDLGEVKGKLYLAMDYVRGCDAGRIVKEQGPMPVGLAVRLINFMLQALEYAHAKGFVHRDIKPGNFLVGQNDAHEQAWLADFGLARVYQASPLSGLTMLGDVAGTMAYMAPEQLTNLRAAQPPVDQYAAAASLYHLLTGKAIFDLPKASHEKILTILHEEPVPLRERRPALSADLAEVIHKALAKNPERRYGSVRDFRRALAKFASQ